MTRWHHPHEIDSLNEVGGHCPRCDAEYRPGFTMCADCEVPLVPGPAPAKEEPPAEPSVPLTVGKDAGEPVTVAHLRREEAWLLAGRLRADGIPAEVIDRTFLGSVYGGAAIGLFDVIVPHSAAGEAARIVERYAGHDPG